MLVEVFKIVFNMKKYGSETLKPTMVLSNSLGLCTMRDSKHKKTKSRTSSKKKRKPGKALCRKYRDGRGRVRFQGTKALKLSQTFGSYLSKFWQQVVQRVKEFLYFTNAFFRCLV